MIWWIFLSVLYLLLLYSDNVSFVIFDSLKIAWLRVDTQTILTIQTHVITKNHRMTVTHAEKRAWQLKIRDVKETDKGWYMVSRIEWVFEKKKFGALGGWLFDSDYVTFNTYDSKEHMIGIGANHRRSDKKKELRFLFFYSLFSSV